MTGRKAEAVPLFIAGLLYFTYVRVSKPGLRKCVDKLIFREQVDKPVLHHRARVDNRKYKDTFHTKAKMIPGDRVEELIGHAPGGVCPFGINEGVPVYMDESLRKYQVVYPAAGDDHSAVKLTTEELEAASGAIGWVDVCK